MLLIADATLLKTALFFLVIACVALLLVARRTGKRLDLLRRGVDRIADGRAEPMIPLYNGGPTGDLSTSLNRMADAYEQRLKSFDEQQNETEAILTSMVEGVLAVDLDERLISINSAAARLLRIDPYRVEGRSIQESVRNTAVQQFVAKAVSSDSPIEDDLVLRLLGDNNEARERYVQAQGTALRDTGGKRIGALIVLHDVTRLRRLEMIRRDFVANVSHELKTPITAIKGSVETLLDSLTDQPHENEQFLNIISRQADRLNAIVEDLLALARIEQETERDVVDLDEHNIADVMRAAVEMCSINARARKISLSVECDPSLVARINAPLLEQAVVNLIDNAIKYSPEGRSVHLSTEHTQQDFQISVVDEGVGIEREHLPRLFERFYRTDNARSRAMGGTGLGLAIVKHIAQAHHGRVSVESTVGKGSTFRIKLPR